MANEIKIERQGVWWELTSKTPEKVCLYYNDIPEKRLSLHLEKSRFKKTTHVRVASLITGEALASLEISYEELVVHQHDPWLTVELVGDHKFTVFAGETSWPYLLWDMEERKWKLWFSPRATTFGSSWWVQLYGLLFPIPAARYSEVWRMWFGIPLERLKGHWVNE